MAWREDCPRRVLPLRSPTAVPPLQSLRPLPLACGLEEAQLTPISEVFRQCVGIFYVMAILFFSLSQSGNARVGSGCRSNFVCIQKENLGPTPPTLSGLAWPSLVVVPILIGGDRQTLSPLFVFLWLLFFVWLGCSWCLAGLRPSTLERQWSMFKKPLQIFARDTIHRKFAH